MWRGRDFAAFRRIILMIALRHHSTLELRSERGE